MIKAIVFDIGDVIIYDNLDELYKAISGEMKIDLQKFRDFRRGLALPYSEGKLSTEEYIKLIAEEFEIEDVDAFKKLWLEKRDELTKPNREMFRLLDELKKNYVVATLTNITPLSDVARKKMGVYRPFSLIIKSYETGMRKPQEEYFELLLKKLKLSPEEILFVDDKERNLEPAKKLGMKTVLFADNKQFVEELKKQGIKIE